MQVHSPFEPLANGRSDPLSNVLLQEVDCYNTLRSVIAGSLQELEQALHGWVLMSDMLEVMLRSVVNNQVRADQAGFQ
jgi:Dynein heavy chain C-terminal domain